MRILSLFSGAGGLDEGARSANAEIVASIEIDKDCCNTLRLNFRHEVICDYVESMTDHDLRIRKETSWSDLDLIMGGPPCQPFSKSAQWAHSGSRGMADPRSETLSQFCRYVERLRPRAFLLENVEGLRRSGAVEVVTSRLAQSGYTTTSCILDASEYGVPQRRRRLFMVGLLQAAFRFPNPTHGFEGHGKITSWQATWNLPRSYNENLDLLGRWANLVPTIPEGKNYLWHTDRGGGLPLFGWRTKYWSFLLKLAKAEPAPTLVASPSQNSGPFHWDNRLLSTEELAALQSFPRNYGFEGCRTSRQRQIGNAVPPLLAHVLIAEIGAHLGHPVRRVPAELPARSPPEAKIPAVVPDEYRGLMGVHPAHPGTGRGPRPRLQGQASDAVWGVAYRPSARESF